MDQDTLRARREEHRRQYRRRRLIALGVVVLALAGAGGAIAALTAGGGGSESALTVVPTTTLTSTATTSRTTTTKPHASSVTWRPTTVDPDAKATGTPTHTAIPILMYHVILAPPSTVPYPGLYVPPAEFAEQMKALHDAGWHAVTMDQAMAHWKRGVSLGPGKPIVLSFDNGYESQYTKALPVLKHYHWVGVENIQLSGLPPSQGGLSRKQVRGLLKAGWELDTQGYNHADLPTLSASELHHEVAQSREVLRKRYHVEVNWFCYPSGHYTPTVVAAVKAAGYDGSTTVIPGWASSTDDSDRLHRLRVLGGTSGASLLAQIADSRDDGAAPESYTAG